MDFEHIFNTDSSFLFWSFIGLLVGALIYFFYLKNLRDLLAAIREPNRSLAPHMVWLILLNSVGGLIKIPAYYFIYDHPAIATIVNVVIYILAIFVVVWNFRVVSGVAASIEAEYDSRSIPIEHRPTAQTGMFMSVASALMLLREVPYIGMIGTLAAYVYIVTFIMYWVRTARFRKEIQAMAEHQDEESLIFKDLM